MTDLEKNVPVTESVETEFYVEPEPTLAWEHWEVQQALLAGDVDRATELAEMIGLTDWM